MKSAVYFVLGATLFFSTPFAFAQSELPQQSGFANTLVLIVTPQNPRPGEWVTVEVKTTSYDLSRSDIAWYRDEQLIEGGVGITKHVFKIGGKGERTNVWVEVTNPDGNLYQKSITLRPASVDLIWETAGTSHPFYKGKSLYTRMGTVKVIAMPELIDNDGLYIPPENIYYTWKKDSEVLGSKSGYGKNYLLLTDPILRSPFTVEVHAESRDKNYTASGNISIGTTEPLVLVYEDSPLYGTLFNRALVGNFNLTSREVTVESYPFYFNTENKGGLEYQWDINNRTVTDFNGPFLTLRNTIEGVGSSGITVRISNPDKLLESASNGFTITFGNN